MKQLLRPSILFAFIGLVTAVLTVLSFFYPPAIFSDPAWGFLIWKSMQAGAGFNSLTVPDIHDITGNMSRFVAWWSPGQYMVPGVFRKMGFNLGQSLTITISIFSILTIVGYYKVFLALGFSKLTTALSCAVIATTALFTMQFTTYSGGTILLYGVTPWIMLASLRFIEIKPFHIPIFVLLFLFGAFFKHSFALSAVAILFSFFLYQYLKNMEFNFRKLFIYGVKILIPFFIFYAILYFGYTSLDLTPTDVASSKFLEPVVPLRALVYGFVGPIYSFFAVGTFLSNPQLIEAWSIPENFRLNLALVIPCVILTGLIVWQILRLPGLKLYKSHALGFLLTYGLFFTYFMVAGVDVGTGDRQFRPAGIMLIPGVIELLRTYSIRPVRLPAIAVVLFFCLSGLYSVGYQMNVLRQLDNAGSLGFTHQTISRRGLALVRGLDANIPPGDHLFYVSSPEIALEIKRNRVLSSQAMQQPIEALEKLRLKGRIDNVILFLEAALLDDGKADVILKSFVDYDFTSWHSFSIDAQKEGTFVVFYQGNLSRGLDQMGRSIEQETRMRTP